MVVVVAGGGDGFSLVVVVVMMTIVMVVVVVKDHEIESECDEGVHGERRDEVEVKNNEIECETKLNKFN